MNTMFPAKPWSCPAAIAMALLMAPAAVADHPIDPAVVYVPPSFVHPFLSADQILLIDSASHLGSHYAAGTVQVAQNLDDNSISATLASKNLEASRSYSIWWIVVEKAHASGAPINHVGLDFSVERAMVAPGTFALWGGQLIASADGNGTATVELKLGAARPAYLGLNTASTDHEMGSVAAFLALRPQ